MSRESKILNAGVFSAQETISHYESFGWELLSLNGSQITMSRETQNPVYSDLVKNQAKYEELTLKYLSISDPSAPARPTEFAFGTCFLLLALAVVPGVIYIAYKINRHNAYKEAMQRYQDEKHEADKNRASILEQMKQVALNSRATFFSRQS